MTSDDEFPASAHDRASFDASKAKRAARDPERPGEKCRAPAALYEPRIARDRCEGKAECTAVCPHDVFEVRRIDDGDFDALSFLGRLKSRVHGRLTAYTPRADACQACGLCVVACPEGAITLIRRARRS